MYIIFKYINQKYSFLLSFLALTFLMISAVLILFYLSLPNLLLSLHFSLVPFFSLPSISFHFSSLLFTSTLSFSLLPLLSPTSRLFLFILYPSDNEFHKYDSSQCTKVMLPITFLSADDSEYFVCQVQICIQIFTNSRIID